MVYIHEEDIKDFFFHKLVDAGLAPEDSDLTVIAEITFDFLCEVGVLDPENIIEENDYEDYE
jgi:hypothetical protein